MKDSNELDSLAVYDTFPSDYLLGVYLPLWVPICFPIIQEAIFRLKNFKNRK